MATPNPNQLEIAHAFLKYFNARDFDALAELLSPDMKHQYFPASMSALTSDGKDERGKQDVIARLKRSYERTFDTMTFQPPLDVIHGVDAVVFHIKCEGVSKSGKDYLNEFMFTFHFDGEKIIRLNEFADSKYSFEFFTALRAESSWLAWSIHVVHVVSMHTLLYFY
ncbi:hypothetical protein B0H11DRAFT_2286989 [Mycena galericulata]|nr:hypothetical protein B0H11DRAFT_2286989 [Mycena galericulata]